MTILGISWCPQMWSCLLDSFCTCGLMMFHDASWCLVIFDDDWYWLVLSGFVLFVSVFVSVFDVVWIYLDMLGWCFMVFHGNFSLWYDTLQRCIIVVLRFSNSILVELKCLCTRFACETHMFVSQKLHNLHFSFPHGNWQL